MRNMNFKKLFNSRCLFYVLYKNISKSNRFIPFESEPGVYPYLRRQVPSDGLKSLNERLEEINKAKLDVELDPVNIGFKIPVNATDGNKPKKIDFKKLSTNNDHLSIDVNDLYHRSKSTNSAILRKFNLGKFYNIYSDLFQSPHFFYPIKPMEIEFEYDQDHTIPVYHGNLISSSNATIEPFVSFESDSETLWTLVMSCPDEHLEYDNKEYVHWILSNIVIKDGVLQHADRIVPYLQPIPYLGTGFHRYVFVLYQQDHRGRIDLSAHTLPSNKCPLEDRTFSSYDFLKANQDRLTPVGLSFFQSSWDPSVRQCFRETINCLEPIFEYKWPRDKLKPMEEFPENEVMHHYFDQYRDVKDIQEEVLKEQLKTVDPFKITERLEFPLGIPDDPDEMGFVKEKFRDRQLRRNQWKQMDITD